MRTAPEIADDLHRASHGAISSPVIRGLLREAARLLLEQESQLASARRLLSRTPGVRWDEIP